MVHICGGVIHDMGGWRVEGNLRHSSNMGKVVSLIESVASKAGLTSSATLYWVIPSEMGDQPTFLIAAINCFEGTKNV